MNSTPDVLSARDLARFWSMVDQSGGPDACWLWKAARLGRGYGGFRLQGKMKSAHRVSYQIHFGPIPAGLWVLHNCPGGDNPACVNPAHLWLGTHQDNMADMVLKDRQASGDRHFSQTSPERLARGERHGAYTMPDRRPRGDRHGSHTKPESIHLGEANGRAILTESDVRAIRLAFDQGMRIATLARSYGVGWTAIFRIVKRESWRHVD